MLKLVCGADGAAVEIVAAFEASAAYTREQSRQLDRLAIETGAGSGLALMRRAGAAAFAALQKFYPNCRSPLVVCGAGNNAGDGYIVAALARQAGMRARVCALTPPQSLRGDAARAAEEYRRQDTIHDAPTAADIEAADVIVDAIFGTGLDREVKGAPLAAIRQLNQAAAPVLALDVPSGLHADTGAVLGAAARARHTVTFIGVKQGLLTAAGPDYSGELALADLALPAEIYRRVSPNARIWTDAARAKYLPPRPRSAHKGDHGQVLVIGGDYGYLGAVCLAAQAAARVGAGLITVASREAHARSLALQTPEIMSLAVEKGADLTAALSRAHCIVIGLGLGQSAWAKALLQRALRYEQPLIIDADALNLLASAGGGKHKQARNRILTPHPGEAARLLGCDTAAIQADRFAAAAALQRRYGGVVVLKGVGTIIKEAGPPPTGFSLCRAGNPGMGTGGMGDVLSGVIAGLAAQGLPPSTAAGLGVYLHATAADQAAAEGGERGLLASDLLPHLRRLVNP